MTGWLGGITLATVDEPAHKVYVLVITIVSYYILTILGYIRH
jgi:hypothetical protein